jgi:peptidoglycan/LPS O-acetylase OafA/YrhL
MSSRQLSGGADGSSRIVQLDGLRGIAVAMVFIHHAYRVPFLWMGVDLFFVLSGFLITGILFNQKSKPFGAYIRHFYTRRARRILPPYLIVLLITGFFFSFSFLRVWYLYLGAMNFQGPLLPEGRENLPLWSLAVEEQFYLLWPAIVFLLNRRQLIRVTGSLIVLATLLRFLCTPYVPNRYVIYELLPFRMDTLAAGALIALLWPTLRTRIQTLPRWQPALSAAGACMIGFGLLAISYLHGHGYKMTGNTRIGNTWDFAAALSIASGMLLLALLGVGKKILVFTPLVWLGRISFSIYLIHLTALQFAPWHSITLAIAITLAYATAMWFLIERPLTSPGQRFEKVIVPDPLQP